MDVFIKVKDSDNSVVFVSRLTSDAESGHTIYEEQYTGSFIWNATTKTVTRDGVEDYS